MRIRKFNRLAAAAAVLMAGLVSAQAAKVPTAEAAVRYAITNRAGALHPGGALLRWDPFDRNGNDVIRLAAGTPVDIHCQAAADYEIGADGLYAGYIWNLVAVSAATVGSNPDAYYPEYGTYGLWVADAAVNTPATDGGFSAGIPRCPLSYAGTSIFMVRDPQTGQNVDRNHLLPSRTYEVGMNVVLNGSFWPPTCDTPYATKLGTESPRDRPATYASARAGEPSGLGSNRVGFLTSESLFGCGAIPRASEVPNNTPGEFGSVSTYFQIRTPANGGTYSETFRLVSEGNQWFSGPPITMSFSVDGPRPTIGFVNGDFEAGTSPWKLMNIPGSTNRSIYSNPARARSGSNFMEANTSATGGSVGQDTDIVPQPGLYYRLRVWVKDPTGGRSTVAVTLWALGGAQEVAQTRATVGGDWTPVDVVLRPSNGGHSSLRVEFYMETLGRNVNFDDASLTITSSDPAVNTSNPVGSFDAVSSPTGGAVRVTGWTFDPNDPLASNNVHVYIGGPAGDPVATGVDIGAASAPRGDVAAAYPYAGGAHGFDQTLQTNRTGTFPVCVYGINVAAGGNAALSPACRNVTVAPRAASNDNFASATALPGTSGSQPFDTTNASLEPGEPAHGTANGPSVWFGFTPTGAGTLTVSTLGTTWDTVLAAYTGSTVSTLTQIRANDDVNGTTQSEIQVPVVAGQRVSIAVSGYSGRSGPGTVNWSFAPATAPGAPSNVRATPGPASASVSWVAPSSGSSSITSYTVTASPGGFTCTSSTTSCSVTRLTNGTAYSFTVRAISAVGTGPASTPSNVVVPAAITVAESPPGAPANVKAQGGDRTATVSWSVPSSGSSPINSYVVVSAPGSLSCTTSATSCTVPNLTNGVTYTFTVRAINAFGPGPSSGASNAVVPATQQAAGGPVPVSGVSPVTPVRLFDSRVSEPSGAIVIAKGRYGGGREIRVKVAGVAGVPMTAAAVSLNVTATGSSLPGFVTVYPCGARPLASNVNFAAGATVANTVIAGLSPSGEVCFYANADVDLLADLNTWIS